MSSLAVPVRGHTVWSYGGPYAPTSPEDDAGQLPSLGLRWRVCGAGRGRIRFF